MRWEHQLYNFHKSRVLTNEISQLTNAKQFDIDLDSTSERCRELIQDGHYAAIIGEYGGLPIAVVTLTERYALYAGTRPETD